MRWNRLFLSMLLGLGLVLVACGPRDAESEAESAPPSELPVRGGTLRAVIGRDPGSLTTVARNSNVANWVFAMLQPSLVEIEADGSLTPALLESWTWSEDQLQLEAQIDATLRWSDGAPFVAKDIEATLELYALEDLPYVGRRTLANVESVEALDDTRVRFRFRERQGDQIRSILHDILPAHVISDLNVEDPASWDINRMPITLGPYRLKEWVSNERIDLERNPHHPRPGHVDAIQLYIVPDPSVAMLRLQVGEVDMIPAIPMVDLERARQNEDIEVVPVSGGLFSLLYLNLEDPILSELAVRRALTHAIDRQSLADGPLFGTAIPANGILTVASWAYDASRQADRYDPELSRRLLDEAGWKPTAAGAREREGQKLQLEMLAAVASTDREAIVTMMKAQFEAVGIEVTVQAMDTGSAANRMAEDGSQMLYVRAGSPSNADLRNYFASGGRMNLSRYDNPDFDALQERIADALERSEAIALAAEAEAMLNRDLPAAFLLHPQRVLGFSSRVRGASPTSSNAYHHIQDWWLVDGGTTP